MIELINVKKDYVVGKSVTHALKGVSFKLPDKGMIFITGKSGSGKSTLMNILGGLDDKTAGSIFIDGTEITNEKNNVLDEYRNKYVGIVYQNFNLFQGETVYENMKDAVSISDHKITEEDYDKILESVDLTNRKYKLVKNLSGGQRQRVAIARALIKKPELILADEPTGNLDSKSAQNIFEFLKNISEDKLVVIISHDKQSAEKYADRIITLKDGLIAHDKIKNKNLSSTTKFIEIKEEQNVTKEELDEINKKLGDKVKIVSESENYVDFKENIEITKEPPEFKHGKLKYKSSFALAMKLFKSGRFSFAATLFISTLLFVVLSLSNSLTHFDGKESVESVIQKNNVHSFVISKAYSQYDNPNKLEKSNQIRITDEDIQAFREKGYTDNIYYVYNTPVDIRENYSIETFVPPKNTYVGLYASTALGTIVCDDAYLSNLFGDVKVTAGSIEKTRTSCDVIITDFIADSIIELTPNDEFESDDPNDPYQKLLSKQINERFTVGAVIDTNYKERYKELFDIYEKAKENGSQDLIKLLANSEIYSNWNDELNSSLNYFYTLNPNFVSDYASKATFAQLEETVACTSDGQRVDLKSPNYFSTGPKIQNGEISLSKTYYEQIFGEDVPFEARVGDTYITFQIFTRNGDKLNDTPFYSKKFKITEVASGLVAPCIGNISQEDITDIANHTIFPFSLAMGNMDQIYGISQTAVERCFYSNISIFSTIFSVFDTVTLYSDIFIYVVLLILIVMLGIISMHNLHLVRKNQYRIGVYRGLGYTNRNIVFASLINLLILTISLCVCAFVATYIFDTIANIVLVKSFYERFHNSAILGFVLIKFDPGYFFLFNSIIFAISFISMIAPVVFVRRLKPNKILHRVDE